MSKLTELGQLIILGLISRAFEKQISDIPKLEFIYSPVDTTVAFFSYDFIPKQKLNKKELMSTK